MHTYKLFLFFIVSCSSLFSQSFKVALPDRTTLDDENMHLTLFSHHPREQLILPQISLTNALYFDLFNSWNVKNDQAISCIVFPSDTGDILYVDLNNDEDLTNDGGAIFFPKSQNNIVFDIINTPDTLQIVKLMVKRKPDLSDSALSKFVDQNGNLNPKFAAFYGAIPGQSEITGKRGTFYFDDRVSLRSGIVRIQDQTFRIGLFDCDNNGLFNDSNDVLIVDLNEDGKLQYQDYSEIVQLNDVFTISGSNYKLSGVDRYGMWVELTKTNEQPKQLFLKKQRALEGRSFDTGVLDSTFWDGKIQLLDGSLIQLQSYKGKYLLLNVWGEWCGPCVEEIPTLVEAYHTYDRTKFEIVGLLQTHDLAIAKNLINAKDMTWNEAILSKEFEKKFAIQGYPTNILIMPDGKKYVRIIGAMNKVSFEQHIH